MKSKIIISFLCMILLASMVSAISVTNVKSPLGTITSSRSVVFTFTLDEEPVGCWLEIGLSNGTIVGNHSKGDIATTKSGKEYTNSSYAVPIDSDVSSSHNWSIYCGATAATSTIIDTKTFNLKVNTPTSVIPLAGTIYNTQSINPSMTVPVIILTNESYICQYQLNLTNGTKVSWTNLISTTNLTWFNSSAFSVGIDSAVGKSHNMTYKCNDSTGTNEGEEISFKVDTTSPTITMGNITRSSSAGTYIAAVSDTTGIACSATLYDNTGASAGTLSGTSSGTGSSKNCTYTLTATDLGNVEGDFNIEPIITDQASNVGTLANKTGVLRMLYTGWNIISWSDVQRNLSTICSGISGCTQASYFNNTAKAFTTYSASAPTVNAGTNIPSADNVHIYVTANTYLLMDNYYSSRTADNQSIYIGWNLLSLYNSTTLNTTLYAFVNITWASYFNGSEGNYYTCSKSLSKCAGTDNAPAAITMPKGTSAWVLTEVNGTLNRSEVSG